MSSEAQPDNQLGAVSKRATIVSFVKDWKEIIIGTIAIAAVLLAAVNYFISRKEFEAVRCQIHNLIQLTTLELAEMKIVEEQRHNIREMIQIKNKQESTSEDLVTIATRESVNTRMNQDIGRVRQEISRIKRDVDLGNCAAHG